MHLKFLQVLEIKLIKDIIPVVVSLQLFGNAKTTIFGHKFWGFSGNL
jgi:hypothetical protein